MRSDPQLEELAARLLDVPYVLGGRDPATGLDCYGLMVTLYRLRWGIALPHYALDGSRAGSGAAAQGIAKEAQSWLPIAAGQELPGDAIVMRGRFGLPLHLGVVLSPGRMVQTDRGGMSMPRYDGGVWCTCLSGFYRHPLLALSSR